jgi:hypothetical protein
MDQCNNCVLGYEEVGGPGEGLCPHASPPRRQPTHPVFTATPTPQPAFTGVGGPCEWQADMLVSELLGSFGDNELSPECLDGAQKFLKGERGVCGGGGVGR